MILYLGAWAFAVAFIAGGVWTCHRLSARVIAEDAPTNAQRAQVTILEDSEGSYIEGEATWLN